ncbi:MAG: hypothetical protein Ct9H90mP3_4930 [Flammeovirgaceae bacterium]|nr:MAG: hypothetical protein Ct9H90mP3_4930 [Flammeovirgaceae bacterium]
MVGQLQNFCENLEEKIKLFEDSDLMFTLEVLFLKLLQLEINLKTISKSLKKYNLKYAEVSDGSISIPHKKKCEYIEKFG